MNKQNYSSDQNIGMPQRSKKRRLDHLTWEEKMQRKKMKNRVAAQTSRDRKKAKMEEMEHALQQLFSKNENLLAECESLKQANQRLSQENAEVYERLRSPCATDPPSTERKGHTLSSDFGQGSASVPACSIVEDRTELPSLPDLLDELDTDVDLNSLEQLTQSLLQDIARDLEAASQKTDCQEPEHTEHSPCEVVGQTPTQLEPSGCDMLTSKKSLESDISKYLLLHHNYAAKPPESTKKSKTHSTRNRFKAIRPKSKILEVSNSIAETKNENLTVVAEGSVLVGENEEIFYGTLDEDTNIVTIYVDSDNVPTETVAEIVAMETDETSNENTLTIPQQSTECPSPLSCSGSDKGYESLDSPSSIQDDVWDQSFSELFPSLF
ncbi:hypothetical protein JTB14_002037 [Gonioctena quinquepunctata]|nr:hypothetical protein JTB14_002037 [Gonioctena quinquepunctata]